MKIPVGVNHFRRKVMCNLTGGIGKGSVHIPANVTVKRILISRPNHRLGNMLLITPLIQEIERIFPDARVDLFVKGNIAFDLFKNYPNVDRIMPLPKKPFSNLASYSWAWRKIKQKKYDLVINIDPKSSSGRLSTKMSRSRIRVFGDDLLTPEYPDSRHIAKLPVYNLRTIASMLELKVPDAPVPGLDLKLSAEELSHGKSVLEELFGNTQKTICIFTYATGNKCFGPEWWTPFYEKLKSDYPQYNILEILPAENVSQINFQAKTFYSRDIREIAAVMANSAIFIGADSGIMHLASAAKATTIGLFSVTNPDKYQPYANGSCSLDTRKSCFEEWFATLNRILAA